MSDENIIYQDLILTNTDLTPVLARIVQTRSTPIVNKPDEYELQVQRMQVSLREVPLFFPDIPDSKLPYQTDMSITLSYLGNTFREFINVTPQQVRYGVFSYQNYLNRLNAASSLAFTNLKAAFPGASGTVAPQFYLNPVTALISMYVEDDYLDTNPNRIVIAFNQILQQIMNFPFDITNPIPDPNGMEFILSVNGSALMLPVAPRVGYPFNVNTIPNPVLQVQQDFVSMDEWDNVKSIVLLSNMIPTAREMVPNLTNAQQSSTVTNSTMGILIDFELIRSNPYEPRHIAQYVPQSEFIMKSLNNNTPLNQVDIQAYYQTYSGKLFEIYLGNNTNLSVKLMFRRKHKI